MFQRPMATNVRPLTAHEPTRSAWRRALNISIVIVLVVASVAAQAVDVTPLAIVLLIAAICALAPLFTPAIDA